MMYLCWIIFEVLNLPLKDFKVVLNFNKVKLKKYEMLQNYLRIFIKNLVKEFRRRSKRKKIDTDLAMKNFN